MSLAFFIRDMTKATDGMQTESHCATRYIIPYPESKGQRPPCAFAAFQILVILNKVHVQATDATVPLKKEFKQGPLAQAELR
jgi:hypothetical protein